MKRQYAVTDEILSYKEKKLISNNKSKSTVNDLETLSDEDNAEQFGKNIRHEVLSLSSDSDSLCSISDTLPKYVTC